MQLFHLVNAGAKRMNTMIDYIHSHNTTNVPLENINFTLGEYSLGTGKMEGKPLEDSSRVKQPGIDLEVMADERGLVNVGVIQQGVQDFIGSVLNFALNPTIRSQDAELNKLPISIYQDPEHVGELRAYFPKLEKTTFDMRKLCDQIDHIENLMFAGWRPQRPKSHKLIKTFASQEDCDRTAHLIICMGNALGLTDEQMNRSFYQPPNDHALVVHEELMTMLARAEQTMEADFGRRRA